MNEKPLIKAGEAARILGIDIGTLRKWGASGELPPHYTALSGTRFYLRSDITAFLTKPEKPIGGDSRHGVKHDQGGSSGG